MKINKYKCDSCGALFDPEDNQDIFNQIIKVKPGLDLKIILIVRPENSSQDLCPQCNCDLVDEIGLSNIIWNQGDYQKDLKEVSDNEH